MVYLIMQRRTKYFRKSVHSEIKAKNILIFFLLLVLLCLVTSEAMASTVAYREAGLEMDIPEGLILEIHNGFLTVVNSERTMTLMVTLSSLQVVEHFYGPLEEELSNFIDQPEVREEQPKIKVNDTLQYYAEGVGLREDEIVDWHIAFIAGGRRSLLFIGLGDVASCMDKINAFYRSFRLLELPIPPEPEEETEEGDAKSTLENKPATSYFR